jgi:hypothetical protein
MLGGGARRGVLEGGGARCLRGARVWQGVVRFIGIIREGYILGPI